VPKSKPKSAIDLAILEAKQIRKWGIVHPDPSLERMVAGFEALLEDRDKWKQLDSEAATHVESLICMRTSFRGHPPYVGWKGLGLWLKWEFDRRDAALKIIEMVIKGINHLQRTSLTSSERNRVAIHYMQELTRGLESFEPFKNPPGQEQKDD